MQINLNIDWKKTLLIAADVVIAIYLLLVFVSWHKPTNNSQVCREVTIEVADENKNGFLKKDEVQSLLENSKMYPLSKSVMDISTRDIETQLMQMPFVKTAQCYMTQEGNISMTITQRTPVVRVKAESGDDYYINDNGGIMPKSKYTSDMIIATGNISRRYAMQYIYNLASVLMADDFWRNQIEQINVLPDYTVELVPRVGDHVVNIGILPNANTAAKRKQAIEDYVHHQLNRLQMFYKHGLCHSGWRKYDYISLEFKHQIICRKRSYDVEEPATVSDSESTLHEEGNSDKKDNTVKENI